MSTSRKNPGTVGQLRSAAEDRLRSGTAPFTNGLPSGTQALTLLHRLASDPARATDALKLLHELQVHQVELDLQQEQIEQERRLYEESLDAYIGLFEFAPFAYLTLDSDGKLLDANRVGAEWLGVPRDEWLRRQVRAFFAPESRLVIQNVLADLRTDSASTTFTAWPASGGDGVQVTVTAARDGRPVLMAFMPIAKTPGS